MVSFFNLASSHAQLALGTASDFSTSAYFNPPHETQMKSLVTGAEARPQPGGGLLITKLRLETFHEDGAREMLVEAPECVFNPAKATASSSGKVTMQTGDGQYLVEGEGFCWRQDEGILSISNRVRTVVNGAAMSAQRP